MAIANQQNFQQIFDDICSKLQIVSLNDFQKDAIKYILSGKDVFVGTPTGSGKSKVYYGVGASLNKKILIISPLISIMREQVEELNKLHLSAGYIGQNDDVDKSIIDGNINFIFSSPESALGQQKFRSLWPQLDLGLVVVDEVHMVTTWGDCGTNQDAPFRDWFGKIGELRSLTRTPMLALSATCSPSNRKKLLNKLNMKNSVYIGGSVDRPNIKLNVTNIPASLPAEIVFDQLVKDLEMRPESFDRHLIFCNSIKDCAVLYLVCKAVVKNRQLFQMFHSKTPETVKEKIRKDMESADGNIKLLIATKSASMGVNYKGVKTVINYGIPHDMDSFVQELGRAGRDGSQAQSVVIYKNRELHLVDSEMKLYVCGVSDIKVSQDDIPTCRRQNLLKFYSSNHSISQPCAHLCCDLCAKICQCGKSDCPLTPPIVTNIHLDSQGELPDSYLPSVKCRTLDEEAKIILKHRLQAYQLSLTEEIGESGEASSVSILPNKVIHGFSTDLITDIIKNCEYFTSVDDIIQTLPIWSIKHAKDCFEIIKTCF